MKLPVPIVQDGIEYVEAGLREITAGEIAAARRAVEDGDPYMAIAEWCAGCVSSLKSKDGDEADGIKRAMKVAPYRTAMALALYGRAQMADDDGISGSVVCPECNSRQKLSKKEGEDGIEDTRDHLYALPVEYADHNELVRLTLKSPVTLKKKGRRDEEAEEVVITSYAIRHPTLTDFSRAHKMAQGDSSREQALVYAEALEELDGEAVPAAIRATFGELFFNKMSASDSSELADAVGKYGINESVARYCQKCEASWEGEVSTMDFFASALRRKG